MGSVSCRVSCCCAQQTAQSGDNPLTPDSNSKNGDQVPADVEANGLETKEIILLSDENTFPPTTLITQQLHDIEEEEDQGNGNDDLLSVSSSSLTIKKEHQKLCNSPSPTFSSAFIKSSSSSDRKKKKKKVRTRSVTSTTSSDTCGSGSHKMQAEQGSIGDLQKYHNRYLRNRRHTLANVR